MTPSNDIGDLYEKLRELSARLDSVPTPSKERAALEEERDRLRQQARSLAGAGRHPVSIDREISSIEQRLAEIEQLKIRAGGSERRPGIRLQDASAYRGTINRLIDEQYADEIADLRDRLATLERARMDFETR